MSGCQLISALRETFGRYDTEVGDGDIVPDSWLGEIEATFLSYERLPVLRRSIFSEVRFHCFYLLVPQTR